jgi:hypothetical protein
MGAAGSYDASEAFSLSNISKWKVMSVARITTSQWMCMNVCACVGPKERRPWSGRDVWDGAGLAGAPLTMTVRTSLYSLLLRKRKMPCLAARANVCAHE